MSTTHLRPKTSLAAPVELCGMDLLAGFRRVNTVGFFNTAVDCSRFRDACAATLEHYPWLGGKLVKRDGRLFVDPNGTGLSFTIQDVSAPCPAYGPDVFPVDMTALLPDGAQAVQGMDGSLGGIKLTRFADGKVAIGKSDVHAIADGSGISFMLNDWYDVYMGGSVAAPAVFSREAIVALGREGSDRPSAKCGARRMADVVANAAPQPRAVVHGIVHLTNDTALALQAKAESYGKETSYADYLNALIFGTYARASIDPTVTANVGVDGRRIKELGIPDKFYGNVSIHRSLTRDAREAGGGDWLELSRQLRSLTRGDAEAATQDIRFFEQLYRAGRFNEQGAFMDVMPALANGGIFVSNNVNHRATRFALLRDWSEMAMSGQIGIRMAFAMSDPQGISIRLSLPAAELQAFRRLWPESLHEALRA